MEITIYLQRESHMDGHDNRRNEPDNLGVEIGAVIPKQETELYIHSGCAHFDFATDIALFFLSSSHHKFNQPFTTVSTISLLNPSTSISVRPTYLQAKRFLHLKDDDLTQAATHKKTSFEKSAAGCWIS